MSTVGSARLSLALNVALLCAMTLLPLAGTGSVAVNVAWFVDGPARGPLLEDPGRIGNLIAYVVCGVWALGGAWVAPITAVGLTVRAPWSRGLARVYGAPSLPTVCCLPLGVFGLWIMSRDDVRRALAPVEPASR